jgi:hypothetical protein
LRINVRNITQDELVSAHGYDFNFGQLLWPLFLSVPVPVMILRFLSSSSSHNPASSLWTSPVGDSNDRLTREMCWPFVASSQGHWLRLELIRLIPREISLSKSAADRVLAGGEGGKDAEKK